MSKVFPSEAKIREVMHEPNVVFRCVGKESKSYRLRQGASVWIRQSNRLRHLGEVAELVKGAAL